MSWLICYLASFEVSSSLEGFVDPLWLSRHLHPRLCPSCKSNRGRNAMTSMMRWAKIRRSKGSVVSSKMFKYTSSGKRKNIAGSFTGHWVMAPRGMFFILILAHFLGVKECRLLQDRLWHPAVNKWPLYGSRWEHCRKTQSHHPTSHEIIKRVRS